MSSTSATSSTNTLSISGITNNLKQYLSTGLQSTQTSQSIILGVTNALFSGILAGQTTGQASVMAVYQNIQYGCSDLISAVAGLSLNNISNFKSLLSFSSCAHIFLSFIYSIPTLRSMFSNISVTIPKGDMTVFIFGSILLVLLVPIIQNCSNFALTMSTNANGAQNMLFELIDVVAGFFSMFMATDYVFSLIKSYIQSKSKLLSCFGSSSTSGNLQSAHVSAVSNLVQNAINTASGSTSGSASGSASGS